jgi:hypothetical protein
MRPSPHPEPAAPLLAEGRRWGFGAHSIEPYLALMQQSRPGPAGDALDASIRNPVFPQMDKALRRLRRSQ